MKSKIFLLIFLFLILIFVISFIPLISSLQATIIPYNFTNLSDRNAYSGYPATQQIFNGTNVANNYGNTSAANYTQLQTRNNQFANQSSHGGNDQPFWRFNFTVKDAQNHRTDIQWLTVNVTGKGRIGTGTELGVVYIYNFSSSALVTFGTFTATNANYSMNFTENINATNFMTSDGNVTVYIQGINSDALEEVDVDFVQVDIMYLKDVDAPNWSSNSTNSTLAGQTVNHQVFWTDDVSLNTSIFSLDNGNGSFLNYTTLAIDSTNWTNFSFVINSTSGSTIRWRVYVNDSSNNLNVTSNFQYTTTAGPTDSCTCTDGASWTIINGDQCTLSTSCNLGNNRFRIMDGALRITSSGRLIAQGCYVQNTKSLFVINGGRLVCR